VTPQNIKQGDDVLKRIVPVIMASNACKNGGDW
jgi:hypothetical protein